MSMRFRVEGLGGLCLSAAILILTIGATSAIEHLVLAAAQLEAFQSRLEERRDGLDRKTGLYDEAKRPDSSNDEDLALMQLATAAGASVRLGSRSLGAVNGVAIALMMIVSMRGVIRRKSAPSVRIGNGAVLLIWLVWSVNALRGPDY
jgi:hypothetical protein